MPATFNAYRGQHTLTFKSRENMTSNSKVYSISKSTNARSFHFSPTTYGTVVAMSRTHDLACLLRSLQLIAEASIKLQEESLRHIWKNSSFRPLVENCSATCKIQSNETSKNTLGIGDVAKDSVNRLTTVLHGLGVYKDVALRDQTTSQLSPETKKVIPENSGISSNISELESKKSETEKSNSTPNYSFKIKLTKSDEDLLRKLDMEHRAKLVKAADRNKEENVEAKNEENPKMVAVPNPKSKQKLSENAKQRKVPSSRIGRMYSFGTLAAGLGLGTATEYAKRTLGIGDTPADASNLFMSKANMDRIVDTLCKVRGAALKLGQILSIQDDSVINPDLAKALERVRKSADFMPNWQVEQVMSSELGPNWMENFQEFEERPFAAASIGQVHRAKLKDGQEVAVKIQYPGVAQGIESDINNLGGIMKMWNIFPKGMFLENLMAVAKRELAWEYYVPTVVDHLSTKQVFTTELLDGIPVDQCFDLDAEHRKFIGDKVMELVLLEIMKFRYMQTDPNFANFLYNPNKKQVLLLDFGATREYAKEFMDQYVRILKAACDRDRDTVLNVSKDLGFLTGYESKLMEEAHVDAVMILGEILCTDGEYDFASQNMTSRMQNLAQIMITQRLCPPPEEVYSLHRKLSGVFMLCSKLKIKLACKDRFLKLYNEYVAEGR
ncbi:hypothetical protein JTB14_018368 [Gonioctena quinquepunctata]|nr:hypothetical protein JTB14_018368 [Gonioctena quinquepunctata]